MKTHYFKNFFAFILCFLSLDFSYAAVTFLDSAKPGDPTYSLENLLASSQSKDSPDCSLDEKKQKYKVLAPQVRALLMASDQEIVQLSKPLFAARTLLDSPDFYRELSQLDLSAQAQTVKKIRDNVVYTAETMKAARVILEYNGPDVRFVFLGRTPDWVMHAARLIAKDRGKEWPENFISVNFSGTPDLLIDRIGQINDLERNLVTPERLRVFEEYLSRMGLAKIKSTDKLYIIDMLGKGGGLNSFLRILRHYYTVSLKQELPDISFMALNVARDVPPYEPIHSPTGELRWGKNNQGSLIFNNKEGMTALAVDMIPIGMPEKIMDLFDSVLKSRWSSGSEFYACQWTQSNLEKGFKPNPVFKAIYDEVFESEIKVLLGASKNTTAPGNSSTPSQVIAGVKSCAKCGATTGKIMACGNCKVAHYCSEKCQRQDWTNHRDECKRKGLSKQRE